MTTRSAAFGKGSVKVEFRVLGPVEVWCDGRRLPLGGPKPRALLAALLLQPGRVVSTDALIDALWGESPPGTARALIQTYVSALRRSLPGNVIETRPPGYRLLPAECTVDVTTFEELVAEGRRAMAAGEHGSTARNLARALALWNGPALGGIGDALRADADRLEETRLAVLEERITADLRVSGRESHLVGELTSLVGAHPTRERLRGQLMVALYRLDRQADALAVFAEGRRVLAEELGIDPGPALLQLHEAILRADPALLAPAPTPVHLSATGAAVMASGTDDAPDAPAGAGAGAGAEAAGRRTVPPAILPPTIGDFTGRAAMLDTLVSALSAPRGAVPVVVLSGPGGVGKSTLAVEAAHQVASAYPDGQLYADLRGLSDSPALPDEVCRRFLRALGADPPANLTECFDLFRSMVAGRRILLLLDDAGSEAQVRPLLPGSASCGVLLTSRSRLDGIVGARRLDLDVLDTERAVELLARIAGEDRVRTEPDATERIVRLCGGLPLAIRIAGARLAARRHWTPRVLAGRLADERRLLDELTVGDLEVRAGLGLSYRALSGAARTALRRLGLLGAPHVAAWVVAALLDCSESEADDIVEQLLDAQLLHAMTVDHVGQLRFRLHDLVRVYAAERAELEEPREERAAALGRALGGWLWLTDQISAAAPSGAVPLDPPRSAAWPLGPEVTRRALAAPFAWFEAESQAVAVAVERAAAMDLHSIAHEAAAAMCASSYAIDNRFDAWWRTHDAALSAARRSGDRAGEAALLVGLGQLRYEQDRFAEAQDYFRQARALSATLGDVRGEAAALAGLGSTGRELGRLREAERALNRAARDFRRLGDTISVGLTCRYAGTVHLELGEYPAARALLDEALQAYRSEGSRRGEALTLRSISLIPRALGDFARAEELSEQALGILRDIGDDFMSAYAVQALVKARFRQGKTEGAAERLRDAYDVCSHHRDRFGEALLSRTLGECALAEGRLEVAERYLIESLALWDDVQLVLPRARTLRDLASVRDAAGEGAGAEELRAQAMEIFRACDARERWELAGHTLDRDGVPDGGGIAGGDGVPQVGSVPRATGGRSGTTVDGTGLAGPSVSALETTADRPLCDSLDGHRDAEPEAGA